MPFIRSSLHLLDDFPPATVEEWRAEAEKLLHGASFEEKLVTPLTEGITLQPLFSPDAPGIPPPNVESFPGFDSLRRGATAGGSTQSPWSVAQRIGSRRPADINAVLNTDLAKGLDTIHLLFDDAACLCRDRLSGEEADLGRGCALESLGDLETAFHGIDLARIPLILRVGASALPALALLVALARRRSIPLEHIRGTVGADPLGTLLRLGSLPAPCEIMFDDMRESLEWTSGPLHGVRPVAVEGSTFHNGGADAVQELGLVIATGAEYLRELLIRGCSVDEAAKKFWFCFSLGTDFFLEMAKLRAARMLWSAVVSTFGGGLEAQRMHTHVATSSFALTRRDPYVNMIRATTQALSGSIGGCESMDVESFDGAFRSPDEFSRRIARNTQLVLQKEVHAQHVIDPAGGSWYVEWLTDAVADRSWKIFQQIEAAGGMTQAILRGIPQGMVAETLARRTENLRKKKMLVVGINAYVNPEEQPEGERADHAAQPENLPAPSAESSTTGKAQDLQKDVPAFSVKGRGTPREMMEALIQNASAGATLEELFSAYHGAKRESPRAEAIIPVRLVEEFEDTRMTGEASRESRE